MNDELSILDSIRELNKLLNDAGEDLATIIARYEEMLAAFKTKVAANPATIRSAGYTEIVQAAITVHEYRIAELKKKQSNTVSADDVSYLISQYTSQLDAYAYLGKQLCKDGYVDELSTILPKYRSILASLVALNNASKNSIAAAGYGPIVTGAIELHTLELQALGACIPALVQVPANGIIPGVRVDATVDGDTLTVVIPSAYLESDAEPKVNIRLAGCNAPEKPDSTSQAGNCVVEYTVDNYSSFMYVEKKYYSEATMKLGLLVGGKIVTLKLNPARPYDSYNRLVAVVEAADGTVANEELLRAGLCAYFHRTEWNSTADPVDHNKYIQLESGAKAAKAGIWASATGSAATGQCIITATRPTATGGSTSATALVYVDGTYMGMTSTTEPYILPVGSHTIRTVSSQYGSGTREVTITENCMLTVNVHVGSGSAEEGEGGETTNKGYVTFQVLKQSSGGDFSGTTAELWEGNKYKFLISSNKEYVPTDTGAHTYTFKKDGYEAKNITVTVTKNETALVKAILKPAGSEADDPAAMGTVDFISAPTGAKIYIGEEYIGLTKKLNHQLALGIYSVWIKRAGYVDYTEQILVQPGEKAIVDAQMVTGEGSTEDPTSTTQTGLVDFISTPTGAYIYVENMYVGMTKKVGHKLSAGVHLINIRKNGYEEYEDTVEIVAGERLPIEVTLAQAEIEEEEEEGSATYVPPAGGINWITYPQQNYPTSSYGGSGTGYTATTTQPAVSTVGSTEIPEATPTDTLAVQFIVMQENPNTEKLGYQFKEIREFFRKYCKTELTFTATRHSPVDPDTDEDGNDVFDDIDLIEDQMDIDKVQDEQGIVLLLWESTGKKPGYDGATLSRDELLNGSVVCSIPLNGSQYPFSEEIKKKRKETLGLTSQGSLTMAICLANALLEWYNHDHEAEENTALEELDKIYCGYSEEEKARPNAKCVSKWLKAYNALVEA